MIIEHVIAYLLKNLLGATYQMFIYTFLFLPYLHDKLIVAYPVKFIE
jgi:hypothetical protein